MNTVALFCITYPKPPKGFNGIRYYEKKPLGTYQTANDTLEEVEDELRTRAREFPGVNWFSVENETSGQWVAGTLP